MKKIIFVLLASILFIKMQAQPSLSYKDHIILTPNTNDTIGAFCRLFYNSMQSKFYAVYAARYYNTGLPKGMLQDFRWMELDSLLNPTGTIGVLSGFTSAGDYAMVMVDSIYYHLTNEGSTTSGNLKYRLSKYDDDFNFLNSIIITLNEHDSNIDQLMNYTNERLIIGAMHDSCCTPPTTPPQPFYNPNIHLFQYDLNLSPISSNQLLEPKSYSWGASCIFNNNSYYIVTMDNFNDHILSAYQYDTNFNFMASIPLDADGQWSQGILWEDGYYYVAYHTGEHNHGNVRLGIYDSNWAQVSLTKVTDNLFTDGINSNRPFLLKVGNLLYVSYDVETYNPNSGENHKNWQAHVKVYEIDNTSSIFIQKNLSNELKVYPNPFSSELLVSYSKKIYPVTIRIYDSSQRLMYSQLLRNETPLSLANLSKGIYFLHLNEQVVKLIKN